MWRTDARNEPLPAVTEIKKGDSDEEKQFKQIIIDMTQYTPEDRPTMEDVEHQLANLHGLYTI